MNILEWIYIGVGLLTMTAISIFTITQCFMWFLDIYDRFRNPYHQLYYTKLLKKMSQAFYGDEKIKYIFDEFCQRGLTGRDFDVWGFRDDVEKKFGHTITEKL